MIIIIIKKTWWETIFIIIFIFIKLPKHSLIIINKKKNKIKKTKEPCKPIKKTWYLKIF
jgi:hypothetical protein